MTKRCISLPRFTESSFSFRPAGETTEETLKRALNELKEVRGELEAERENSKKLKCIVQKHRNAIPFCNACEQPTEQEPESCSVCDAQIPCSDWCRNEDDNDDCESIRYCSVSNHMTPRDSSTSSIVLCEDCAVNCIECQNTMCTDCSTPCVQCGASVCDECINKAFKKKCYNCHITSGDGIVFTAPLHTQQQQQKVAIANTVVVTPQKINV